MTQEMSTKAYTLFERKFGSSAENCSKPTGEQLAKFQNKIADEIINFWNQFGWCRYANGLFQFGNPDDYEDILFEWFGERASTMLVLGHTAFADMFILMDGRIRFFDVLYGRLFLTSTGVENYLDSTLPYDNYLDNVLQADVFRDATKRLGYLKQDECFAFVPTIPLGGSMDTKTAKIVKFREHALFLTQITEEVKFLEVGKSVEKRPKEYFQQLAEDLFGEDYSIDDNAK